MAEANVLDYSENRDMLRRHVPSAHLPRPSSGVMGNAWRTLVGCPGIQPFQRSMTSLA
jgi:hypothetical protein